MMCESEDCIADRTTNEKEIQKDEPQKNKRQLLKKRGSKRAGSRVVRSSAKKQIVRGKAFRLPIMFLVLVFCLPLGDASSIEEPCSFSSSAIARSSTGVGQNDVPMTEDENGGAMEGRTSAAGGAAVVVASSSAALTSRNVFDDAVNGAATMEMCREQTVQLQKQQQQQQQQTERLKDENAQLRADRDQWRLHAIENGHIEPPISVGDSMTALVDPTTMPLAIAPPEVNIQTIQRLLPTTS